MSVTRLSDLLVSRGVPIHPEKLDTLAGQELTLLSFEFREGATREAVMMDVADLNGVKHLVYTTGESIVRLLHTLNQDTDLPLQVQFMRQPTGSGRKVWVIQ